MSRYNLFAVGVVDRPGKNGQRLENQQMSQRMWGDEWEMNKLLDLGLSMAGVNTGGSITGGETVNQYKKLAEMTFKRLISEQLQIMLIRGDVHLSIYTRNTNALWADDVTFKTFKYTRNNVNTEFRAMMKQVEKAGLNYLGPLMDMIKVLSNWSSQMKQGKALLRLDYSWS